MRWCIALAVLQAASRSAAPPALVDGMAGRQALYAAMSRGRIADHAYCLTQSPRLADIAQELAAHRN